MVQTLERVIVIGCGKSKLDKPAPARELYTGSLFLACRRYAESQGVPWGILSARYGFVRPDDEIEPYEQKLARRGRDLECWAISAATGLTYWRGGKRIQVECLAGEAYAAPFCAVLESRGIECTKPLLGLGLGARLKRLKHEIEDAAWGAA